MKYISISSLGDPNVLVVQEGPEPECGPDEALIKTAYSGVGGIDAIVRRGDLGEANPKPPFTPGLEVSGEIISVGDKVVGLSVGQKVAALLLLQMGGYAEVVRCKSSSVVVVPESLPLADAASLVNPTTALLAVQIVGPRPGETLVVHGAAGGLGSVIAQVCKAVAPETKVIGTVRTSDKIVVAKSLGYDEVVTSEDFEAGVAGGKTYEMILDPVGGDLCRISLKALVPRGRMVLLGNVSGDTASAIDSQEIWLKSLAVTGFNLGYLNSVDPVTVHSAAKQIVTYAADKQLSLAPTKFFPFANVSEAHAYLESGGAHGRIVLSWGGKI